MTYSFLPYAETKYLEAVQFFEDQCVGLGAALITEFEHIGGIRRIGLTRFPYAVFYRVLLNDQLQITAIAHHRRRPGYWLKCIGA